ncbi:DUF5067 domain-containing protein [Enterococcus sp. BWM-S5]|uniref:DUF5067 domain-containing protein n=1 Tax=Enterococcus larvae TaxID=2794352 RepID=A0ABS4CK05_9ENTE|nr:DUF5067 domain-containing protein [Enterococcus larvae]MBP1046936.1 DUF5067 domain-containing protein [Enterococcus larvae]
MNKRYLLGLLTLFIVGTAINSYWMLHNSAASITPPDSSEAEVSERSDEQVEQSIQINEDIYDDLYTYVSNPQMISQAAIFEQELSFVAEVRGEAMEIESPDDSFVGEWYVTAYLLRDKDTPIYLNISSLEKEDWPQDGDVLKITGKPVGYLYAAYENKRMDVLDMKAVSLEEKRSSTQAAAKETIETDDYKITITDTAVLYDSFDDQTLIIYYTFKNKKSTIAASPIRTHFFFTQGENQLAHTILADSNDQLDSLALKNDLLEPNTELLYYAALKLAEEETPVKMTVYDDEYNVLSMLELAVTEAKQQNE